MHLRLGCSYVEVLSFSGWQILLLMNLHSHVLCIFCFCHKKCFSLLLQYLITTITVHHTVAISVSLSIVFYEINDKHSQLFPEYITSLFLINQQSNSCVVWQGLSANYNDSLRVFKILCWENMQIAHNRKEMWLRPPASKSSLLTLTAHPSLSPDWYSAVLSLCSGWKQSSCGWSGRDNGCWEVQSF